MDDARASGREKQQIFLLNLLTKLIPEDSLAHTNRLNIGSTSIRILIGEQAIKDRSDLCASLIGDLCRWALVVFSTQLHRGSML